MPDIRSISTEANALIYFASIGETITPAPRKWQRKGFDYFAPDASQMLTASGLIEYAHNSQELELTLRGERIA
jgi:hypothetical protein